MLNRMKDDSNDCLKTVEVIELIYGIRTEMFMTAQKRLSE